MAVKSNAAVKRAYMVLKDHNGLFPQMGSDWNIKSKYKSIQMQVQISMNSALKYQIAKCRFS